MFSFFDKDDKDDIDFTELLLGCYKWNKTSDDDKVKYIFEIFDTENNGCITFKELLHVIGTFYVNEGLDEALALDRAYVLFTVFEVDPESSISLNQFMSVCKRNPEFLQNF